MLFRILVYDRSFSLVNDSMGVRQFGLFYGLAQVHVP